MIAFFVYGSRPSAQLSVKTIGAVKGGRCVWVHPHTIDLVEIRLVLFSAPAVFIPFCILFVFLKEKFLAIIVAS